MEEITNGVNNMNLAVDSQKKSRIQISNTKKRLFFYVNLAKRYRQQTMMSNSLPLEWYSLILDLIKLIFSEYIIEITLAKSEKFDELMVAANVEKEVTEAQVRN
ncbi:uncharacterized protein At2g34160-like [Arabidopsis lyrata subsp. lyrata]|uniref:uncharacterized protein At2g34160-like n=1 Tax=Arabidopsis lyrata subsp. lyrata TaxID=81972 RepID=UPI000A29A460|nr:uncharacterized protein At2g34160-like [Arabidopsis lyrata subsp. lyrata]|eukprot:XP_020874189.1 uncharacterized protein At2g34160-like [Arabidopsis lyrata subsp. lyrata]